VRGILQPIKGSQGSCGVKGGGPAKGHRGSAAVSIPDHLLRSGVPPLSARRRHDAVVLICALLRSGIESYSEFPGGATWTPRKPPRSIARCTNPVALASSMNSLI
jgi:hypothetical protein